MQKVNTLQLTVYKKFVILYFDIKQHTLVKIQSSVLNLIIRILPMDIIGCLQTSVLLLDLFLHADRFHFVCNIKLVFRPWLLLDYA